MKVVNELLVLTWNIDSATGGGNSGSLQYCFRESSTCHRACAAAVLLDKFMPQRFKPQRLMSLCVMPCPGKPKKNLSGIWYFGARVSTQCFKAFALRNEVVVWLHL